jgi:hypothetical protein
MSDKQPAGRGLLALRLSLDDETLKEIVTGALKFRKQAPQSLRKRFDNLLRERVGTAVDGFRDPTRAPDFKLIEPLLWLIERSGPVFSVVLEAWALSEVVLRPQMAEHLTNCGVSLAEGPKPIEMKAEWPESDADQVLDEFTEKHPDVSRQIALALACYLTNQSPVDTDEDEEEAPPTMDSPLAAPHLSAWLKELQALPASDPSWSEIDTFIAAVQETAESKWQEIQSRTAVQTAIEEFQKTHAGLIEYFGYASLATFKVDDVTEEKLSDCKKAIDDLGGSFRQWQSISEERCTTYAAELDRQKRLAAEYNRIAELHLALDILIGQPGPEPGGPAPDTEHATEGAAADDIATSDRTAPVVLEPREEPSRPESVPATATAPAPVLSTDSEPIPAENHTQAAAAAVAGAGAEVTIAVAAPEPAAPPEETRQTTVITSPDVNGTATSTGAGGPAQVTEETPPAAEDLEPEPVAALEPQVEEIRPPELRGGDALLSHLIEADDLGLAYWVASSRSARGEDPVIPQSLIGMLIGARLVESSDDPIIEEMRGLVTEYTLTEASHPLLETAAALRPAVLAPTLEVHTWAKIPSGFPALRSLSETLLGFSANNLIFSREDVTGAIEQSAVQLSLADARQAIHNWLQDAPRRSMGYQPATEVWHDLCGTKGELQVLARSAADGALTVDALRDKLGQWQKPAYKNKQIDRLSSKKIDGSNRQALLRAVDDAVEMIDRWCDAAEKAATSTAQNDWQRAQFATLRTQVSDLIRPLHAELTQAIADSNSVTVRAELHCLENSIFSLAELLGLEDEMPERLANRPWNSQRCRDLHTTIAQRLVSYYELDLGPNGEPTNAAEIEPAVSASGPEPRTTAQVVEGWIHREDYRFIPQIVERTTDRESAGLRQRFESSIRNSRAQLTDRLSEARGQIEKAYRDNIIDALPCKLASSHGREV